MENGLEDEGREGRRKEKQRKKRRGKEWKIKVGYL